MCEAYNHRIVGVYPGNPFWEVDRHGREFFMTDDEARAWLQDHALRHDSLEVAILASSGVSLHIARISGIPEIELRVSLEDMDAMDRLRERVIRVGTLV